MIHRRTKGLYIPRLDYPEKKKKSAKKIDGWYTREINKAQRGHCTEKIRHKGHDTATTSRVDIPGKGRKLIHPRTDWLIHPETRYTRNNRG